MANFPKSPPAIGRSTGLRGQNGATGTAGAAGAGTVPGVQTVDSLSGTPRSVTDWGALINTAIASGKRRFVFGPYDYLYSTGINLKQIQGVIFEGAGGLDWYDPGRTDGAGKETGHTRLIFTGASGILEADGIHTCTIDASSVSTGVNGNTGFCMFDLMLMYNNASFTGDLVNCNNGGFGTAERCFFASAAPSSLNTARCALRLGNINDFEARNCMFGSGFTSHLRGWETTSDGNYVEHVKFGHCVFSGPALFNPGGDMLFDHCNFEFPLLTAGQAMITGAAGLVQSYGVELAFRDCTLWDSAGGTYFIQQPTGTNWNMTMMGLQDHTSSNMAKCLDLQGNGAVTLISCELNNICDFGDGTVSTSRKDRIVAIGNSVFKGFSGTPTPFFVNIDKGHPHVFNIANDDLQPGSGQNGITYNGLVSLTHEKVDHDAQVLWSPAVAIHAGATNISNAGVVGCSTDLAGYIAITTGAGGASSTGDLADITFQHPVTSNVGAGGFHAPCPSVIVSPAHLGTNGVGTNSVSACWAAQPYVDILNCDLNTGFSIGVVNAIPANTTIVLAYRVIQM